MMNRLVLAAALALSLAACGGAPPVVQMPSATVISSPAATGGVSRIDQVNRGLAVAEQALTLTYKAALAYTSLPRCGTGPRICSDREVVLDIRKHAIQAHNALVAARKNEASVEYVWAAINTFRAVVPAS